MRYCVIFACIFSSLLVFVNSGYAQNKDGHQLARINPERVRESQKAAQDIISAYREGREFSPGDVRLANTYKIASMAEDINQVAQSETLELTKRINRERIREGVNASSRVVATFNDSGANASFEPSDLQLLQALQTAIAAADTLEKAGSRAAVKILTKDEIAKAVAASNRVLTAFNEKGKDATFTANDKEILRAFVKALQETNK